MVSYTGDQVWEMLKGHQNEEFLTAKGLPFTYTIKGGEIFISRRSKSITRSTFDAAYKKLEETPELITGPKKLGVFGAPYLWSMFCYLKLVTPKRKPKKEFYQMELLLERDSPEEET